MLKNETFQGIVTVETLSSLDLGPKVMIYRFFVFGLREWNLFIQVACRRFV